MNYEFFTCRLLLRCHLDAALAKRSRASLWKRRDLISLHSYQHWAHALGVRRAASRACSTSISSGSCALSTKAFDWAISTYLSRHSWAISPEDRVKDRASGKVSEMAASIFSSTNILLHREKQDKYPTYQGLRRQRCTI